MVSAERMVVYAIASLNQTRQIVKAIRRKDIRMTNKPNLLVMMSDQHAPNIM